MKLTILGCNTYEPIADRNCSGYLIQTNNKNIIFDLGRGTFNELLRMNFDYRDIDAIFISHGHADHFTDLALFLHVSIYEPYNMLRYKELKIFVPKGFKKNIENILDGFNFDINFTKNKISVFEFELNEINIDNVFIKPHLVNHSDKFDCYGFRLKSNDKIFSYTGDCSYSDSLIKLAENSDLFLSDATDCDEKNKGNHLSGNDAGIVAKNSNTKHLVLTHVRNYYKKDVVNDAKKEFDGKITLAKDSMEIDI
ncbi:MAG: MBL fold metallo-hydrolase [Candidatus Woesearchaeota archaeon]